MATPTPETHFINCGPGDTPNSYYIQQNGYIQRPHQETLVGIARAVNNEREQKAWDNITKKSPTRRPLNKKQYNKSRPVVHRTVIFKLKSGTVRRGTTSIKCGPSYFPVTI